jgi:hypothetical protein
MSLCTCVYCGKDSTTSKSVAHIFPEGLKPQGPALKPGIVCDKCNHYFGAKLESVLLSHPHIAFPLQLMGAPGKKGKARKRLSVYEREVEPDADVTFPIAPPTISYDEFGVRTYALQPLVDKNFDMDCFRRALYHIGFNLLIANRGLEAAREERYTPLRNYVRRPRVGERWPFIQITPPPSRWLRTSVGARAVPLKGRELLAIKIFNTDFWIDLLNSGCLLTAQVEGPVTIIGPDWRPPTQEQAPPGTHYRVSILKQDEAR